MKLRISKNLIVLIAIALSFLIANNASATYASYWTISGSSIDNNNYSNNNGYYQQSNCYINSFGTSNAQVNPNTAVTLNWRTSGCSRVYISGMGNTSPNGQSVFYPSQNTTYTLNAYDSLGLSDTKTLKVYVDSNYLNNQDNLNTQNGTPIVNNYYYPTTTKVSTAASTSTVTKTSTNTNTTKNTTNSAASSTNSTNGTNNLGASVANSVSQGSGLTALSLKGSGGFMPSSIWQWILVVILILIIIIIVRTLTNKPAPGPEAHAAPHAH